jgi:hypothetical protein
MAARKTATVRKEAPQNDSAATTFSPDVLKATGTKATRTANQDYFSPIKKGFHFQLGDDVRMTFRIGRKAFIRAVAGIATAAGLIGGGSHVSDIAKVFHQNQGRDPKANVQTVKEAPPRIQEGGRYEFTDANGDKMAWTIPARPQAVSAPAATQLPAPAPAK